MTSQDDEQAVSRDGSECGKSKGAASSSSLVCGTITGADYEDWRCAHCTYVNPKATDVCEMCEKDS